MTAEAKGLRAAVEQVLTPDADLGLVATVKMPGSDLDGATITTERIPFIVLTPNDVAMLRAALSEPDEMVAERERIAAAVAHESYPLHTLDARERLAARIRAGAFKR